MVRARLSPGRWESASELYLEKSLFGIFVKLVVRPFFLCRFGGSRPPIVSVLAVVVRFLIRNSPATVLTTPYEANSEGRVMLTSVS